MDCLGHQFMVFVGGIFMRVSIAVSMGSSNIGTSLLLSWVVLEYEKCVFMKNDLSGSD